jgi:hypothetical protein
MKIMDCFGHEHIKIRFVRHLAHVLKRLPNVKVCRVVSGRKSVETEGRKTRRRTVRTLHKECTKWSFILCQLLKQEFNGLCAKRQIETTRSWKRPQFCVSFPFLPPLHNFTVQWHKHFIFSIFYKVPSWLAVRYIVNSCRASYNSSVFSFLHRVSCSKEENSRFPHFLTTVY